MIPALLCIVAVTIGILIGDWWLMIVAVAAIWGLVWLEWRRVC